MEEKKYLKWYNKIGYGSGDVAGNVVYAFLTSFMMVYLTDSVGLAAGVVGTLIAVSKLFDGFTDIFFGSMIDKTHSKMGKAKPWMLYGYIGCAITLIGCFAVPIGVKGLLAKSKEDIDKCCKGEYFMQLKYVDTKEEIIAINRKSKHIEPHLHNALEIVCVTSGSLELGVGQELYHMEKGDIGFVFPDVIHHYQVLTPGVNKATYLIASPFTIAKFADIMQSMAPEYPIIKAEKVEPEVYRVINAILETEQSDITVAQAYLQIVLARCIGKLNLVEKSSVGSNDLIYQTVSYISANFKKKFSLEEMAKDLGVGKYVLSRLFSKTFHRNFNQYLNDARLNYACHRLENTSDSITNICLDSGFESQRTFNRVFKERYKISPSDYRSTCVKEMLS